MRPGDQERPPPTYRVLPTVPVRTGLPLDERGHDRHERDRLTGRLLLRITTVEPLHVGSGADRVEDLGDRGTMLARDIMVQRTPQGTVPVVPGSSLKGAVRSLAEAIGGGCDLTCDDLERACVVCSLFGHTARRGGYRGRIGFDDAYCANPEQARDAFGVVKGPIPFRPRKQAGRRIYGRNPVPPAAPLPYCVVVPRITFVTRCTFENVTAEELGLVCLASGADGSFLPRLGGAKFANMGAVSVAVGGAVVRHSYREPLAELDAAAAGDLVTSCIAAYRPSEGDPSPLAAIRAVMPPRGKKA